MFNAFKILRERKQSNTDLHQIQKSEEKKAQVIKNRRDRLARQSL